MRRSGIIWSLASLNLVLVGVIVWQGWRLRVLPGPQAEASRVVSVTLSSSSAPPKESPSETRGPASAIFREREQEARVEIRSRAGAESPTNWPKFDWRQVESEDYQTYVKNLRAIGCPEQTLRDIVTADVLQAFVNQRKEAAALRYRDFKFNEFDDGADASFARRRQEVDSAASGTLQSLLGLDQVTPSTAAAWKQAVWEQQLSYLVPDKQQAALDILNRFGAVDVSLPAVISGDRLTTTQAEELQQRLKAFDQRQSELRQLLSPEEFERLDMTISWTADNLRQAMAQFHPSEAEFTQIFREWRAHDQRIAALWANGEPDPGNTQVFANIEKMLGAERYAEYRGTWWK